MEEWYNAFEAAEARLAATASNQEFWFKVRAEARMRGESLSDSDCAAMDADDAEADDARRSWDELSNEFAMFRLARASGTGLAK